MATKRPFSCGTNAGYPERARWAWVANQNAGFASSYPLADLAKQKISNHWMKKSMM